MRTKMMLLLVIPVSLALAACGSPATPQPPTASVAPLVSASAPVASAAPASPAASAPATAAPASPATSALTSTAPAAGVSAVACAGIGTSSGMTDAEALRFMTEVERLYGDATKNVSAIGISACLTGTALDRLTAWVAQLRQDKQFETAEWKVDSAQFSNDQAKVNNGYLVYSGSLPSGDIIYDANNQVVNAPAAAGFVIDQQLAHIVWIDGQWKVADWGGSAGSGG
jgi:hypothetical protein